MPRRARSDEAIGDLEAAFAPRLIEWQRTHGRHGLPWQQTRDPYRVWLSEIMLQQTQVATVLRYYSRFVERFPDVKALAAAAIDDVLALWAGLGYYSRARNLHQCAQVVVDQHGGRFPPTSEALAQLPGIGASTAAAIAAFCFGERVAIFDGNVKRVLARVLGFDADLAQAASQKALWAQATRLLPAGGDGIEAYTQGLMDLGATLCSVRAPRCLLCPVPPLCAAQRAGSPERLPVKSRTLVRTQRESWWLWLERPGQVWLARRPPTGVWAGLWTLPLFDDEAALRAGAQALDATLSPDPEPGIRHALTHFDWLLRPWRATAIPTARESASASSIELDGRWVALDALEAVALPAPLKRLLTPHKAGTAASIS